MKGLITGATGFAGAFLAEHLLASGDQVLVAARGAWPARTPNALTALPRIAWDLADDAGLTSAGQEAIRDFSPDVIYHLAAVSVPQQCGDSNISPAAKAANVDGLARVVDLACSLPRLPRLIFTSSSHVYAPPYDRPLAEDSSLGPARGYGLSKLAGEELLRRAGAERGLDAVIVRAFQHAGPRQTGPLMLPDWMRQLVAPTQAAIHVRSRLRSIDLTDVRDVVKAYRLLAQHGVAGQAYNVGSGQTRRTGEILDQLLQLADCRRPVLSPDRETPAPDPIADISRLQSTTGWRPEIPLEQTLTDTLAWWSQ